MVLITMANIYPSPHLKHVKMTPGERGFAARLLTKLENDYTVWFDLPVGDRQLRPDFIILHPGRGILILEVKDWKLDTIRSIDRKTVELLTKRGIQHVLNPLEQARLYALEIKEKLEKDPFLVEHDNPKFKGRLIFPWGYGVVLTNITRQQIEATQIDQAIEPAHVICKDEMTAHIKAEEFQQRLWNMFHYNYGSLLALSHIDRIRWHLFPEIRIESGSLFEEKNAPVIQNVQPKNNIANTIPDLIKVMDNEQEKFARDLGDGHRMIHGVAGSGKTLILAQRAVQLGGADLPHPVLVLCYNKTLAFQLKKLLAEKGAGNNVHVSHFHGWCSDMCALYQLDLPDDKRPTYELQVKAMMLGAEKGRIPRSQYSSILIDEGHDFEAEWFTLIVHMLDPVTDSLLIVYDDVQSIYKRKKPKSWASVGINVQGKRSKILKLNYRNTAEAIDFAYGFVSGFLDSKKSSETIPLVAPEQSLRHGNTPVTKEFSCFAEEILFLSKQFSELSKEGISLNSIAVLCRFNHQVDQVCKEFQKHGIKAKSTLSNKTGSDAVRVLTMHSSKGLEFYAVAIPDIGCMPCKDADMADEARVLYVAMTRATEHLFLTYHSNSAFTKILSPIKNK